MSTHEKKRILVVEDDTHIAEGLRLNLTMQGYDVVVALNGPEGLQQWRDIGPDLIVLDIMLPGIDGLSVLRSIRLEDERIPILVLSAKAASDDRVRGLSYGVDDYLSKPFNLEELLLRVDRLLTRAGWNRTAGIPDLDERAHFEFGGNSIDFSSGKALGRQGTISLTDQEARLLKLFISSPGTVLSRDRLLEIGWGYTRKVSTRTVDNFIVRLRKYFEEDPKNPRYFKSVRSVGYMFEPDPER